MQRSQSSVLARVNVMHSRTLLLPLVALFCGSAEPCSASPSKRPVSVARLADPRTLHGGKDTVVVGRLSQMTEGLIISEPECRHVCKVSYFFEIPENISNSPDVIRLRENIRLAVTRERRLIVTARVHVVFKGNDSRVGKLILLNSVGSRLDGAR